MSHSINTLALARRWANTSALTRKMGRSLLWLLMLALLAGCGTESAQPTATSIAAVATAIPSPTMAPAPTAVPATATDLSGSLAPWSLVAVGDSIAYNLPHDCPGCTGFVDRYATAIFQATGHPVQVQNLSQHNGLDTDGLLKELESDAIRRDALANADIIVVSIARNDTAWNRKDDPCDGPNGDEPDWTKYNATCTAAAAAIFRSKLQSVYAQIVALRAGKPTIFRTINTYNDWIGWPGHTLSPEGTNATHDFLDAWNEMICQAAKASGFTCVDIYHAFNGSDGLTASSDLLADDYIHPSDKGNEVIANVLTTLGYAPLATGALTPLPTPTVAKPTDIPLPTATLAAAATELPVPSSTAVTQFSGHTDAVRYASFSPDGTNVLTAGADMTVRIWDAASGKELRQFTSEDALFCAVFSPDGTMIVTTGTDGIVKLWDAASGQELRRFSGHNDLVRRAAFSPDGKYLVTTSDDGTARTWDVQTGQTLVTYSNQGPGHVNRVDFSPDGKTVVTSGDDATARIWDPLTGKEIMVFKGHTDIVAGVDFSPDGKNLVTSSFDGSVRLWEVASGKEVLRFAGHEGGAYGAAFSPDGKYVVTSGADNTARLWDAQTGAEVRRFAGHTSAVRNVVFSPDGKYILTASDDGTASLWLTR